MKNKRLIVAWVVLVAWMVLIFFMSNQPGEVSSKQSDLVLKLFSVIGIRLNDASAELATFIVRKGAHFTEYFILYFLSFNLLKHYSNSKKALVYSILLVIAYAISDEVHQYFIPGRAMALKDVIIDSFGGLSAMTILWLKEKSIGSVKIYKQKR